MTELSAPNHARCTVERAAKTSTDGSFEERSPLQSESKAAGEQHRQPRSRGNRPPAGHGAAAVVALTLEKQNMASSFSSTACGDSSGVPTTEVSSDDEK